MNTQIAVNNSQPLTEEIRPFQMHRNLLRDVITKQAGSLDKAVIEGVMNLVEAGATEGSIILTPDRIIIRDNGRGFISREEIYDAFEVFGKSEERKKIAGRWAEFQMGRGQLMSFGKTVYRTNQFEMQVDINEDSLGLGYILKELPDKIPGCVVTVNFYHPLSKEELIEVEELIFRDIRYLDIPITLNGKLISIDPHQVEWDEETPEAFIKYTEDHSIKLYNLGIFVTNHLNYHSAFEFGATVVSKQKIQLNFARNTPLDSDESWQKIRKQIKSHNRKKLATKTNPSLFQAMEIIKAYKDGIIDIKTFGEVNLLRDSKDKKWSIKNIYFNWERYTFGRAKSYEADKIMEAKIALVLDYEDTKHKFGLEELHDEENNWFQLFKKIMKDYCVFRKHNQFIQYLGFGEALTQLGGEHSEILLPEKLTAREQVFLQTINSYGKRIAYLLKLPARKFLIGRKDGCEAWTNGEDFIAVERDFLRRNYNSVVGWGQILLTIAHEFAHFGEAVDQHNYAFYENYHKNSQILLSYQKKIINSYLKKCKTVKLADTDNLIIGIKPRV